MEKIEELNLMLSREKMKNYILEKENEILQEELFKLSDNIKDYEKIRKSFMYRCLKKIKRLFKK